MLTNECLICKKRTENNFFCYDHAIELHKELKDKVNLIEKPNFKNHCLVCGEHENRQILEYNGWGYFCDKDIKEAIDKYSSRLK